MIINEGEKGGDLLAFWMGSGYNEKTIFLKENPFYAV